ncbi:YggS family pyridoxal phosphate-dependent enzyme [Candidatus Synechococcus calcipolaris G9]|uniref:Pyridoxal phosphate homeostasis protein n=1 Tax=Candidatus Synechococcus calcipolaris G9 TaxID=1497997 RepID=A0ABT6EWT6_9SYNE|nr:YggS family pyridoxal phosphate-dependent enzyme [Candidatus Synechococcus calcipolaris]MDG2990240.1 YggS family pyridoxal phosphate-dependent enzyme [Candidatus Synechococcus calcipolaris G9]
MGISTVDPSHHLNLEDRIQALRQSLPPSVRIIAVSKFMPPEAMRRAYGAGIRDFGESRVQEAAHKQSQLADLPDITWHLIGHLQTNKARLALEIFDWIHSLDSLKLAQRLNGLVGDRSPSSDFPRPQVLLQVKLRPDGNKFGWQWPDLEADLPHLDQLGNLSIRGLMTILPQGLTVQDQQTTFTNLHDLALGLEKQPWQRLSFRELSMGMSGDYSLAIEAGATMIRVGTLIFGSRPLGVDSL